MLLFEVGEEDERRLVKELVRLEEMMVAAQVPSVLVGSYYNIIVL